MIRHLVTKLQEATTRDEATSISHELLTAISNKEYPSENFKANTVGMAKETIEIFIREFENKEANHKLLGTLILLDTF